MSSLGDLRKRIAAAIEEARHQNINLADLIPDEVQEHLKIGYNTAENYIVEIEEREKISKEKIITLEQELETSKQAVQNIPDDHKQRKIDLDQAHHATEFYKKLQIAAEERADRFKKKYEEALDQIKDSQETEQKNKRFETENTQLRMSLLKSTEENSALMDKLDAEKDVHLKRLEAKENQLMDLEKVLKKTESQFNVLSHDNLALEGHLSGLFIDLDEETTNTAAALNKTTNRLNATLLLRNATFSEIEPLRRFYGHAHVILIIYQKIFRQLLNTTDSSAYEFPDMIPATLKAASKELEAFTIMRRTFMDAGLEQEEFRRQLDTLAEYGIIMLHSLESIAVDVEQFLKQLCRRPEILQLLKFKFPKKHDFSWISKKR